MAFLYPLHRFCPLTQCLAENILFSLEPQPNFWRDSMLQPILAGKHEKVLPA